MRHAFIHRDLSKREFRAAFATVRKLKGLPLGNQDLNLMLAQQVRWHRDTGNHETPLSVRLTLFKLATGKGL